MKKKCDIKMNLLSQKIVPRGERELIKNVIFFISVKIEEPHGND